MSDGEPAMSDLIEEAAKAMWQQESIRARGAPRLVQWEDGCPDSERDRWVGLARAVFSRLDALGYAVAPKEPTPEMVEACSHVLRSIHQAPTSEMARLLLRAMLAAKEGPK